MLKKIDHTGSDGVRHIYFLDFALNHIPLHGECKVFNAQRKLTNHILYINGERSDIDPATLTNEDKAFLVLQHGIGFID